MPPKRTSANPREQVKLHFQMFTHNTDKANTFRVVENGKLTSKTAKLGGAVGRWKTDPQFVFMPSLGLAGHQDDVLQYLEDIDALEGRNRDKTKFFLTSQNYYSDDLIYSGATFGAVSDSRATLSGTTSVGSLFRGHTVKRKVAGSRSAPREVLASDADRAREIDELVRSCLSIAKETKSKKQSGRMSFLDHVQAGHFLMVHRLTPEGSHAAVVRDGEFGTNQSPMRLPSLGSGVNLYLPLHTLVAKGEVQEDKLAKALEGARNAYAALELDAPEDLENQVRTELDTLLAERRANQKKRDSTKKASPKRRTSATKAKSGKRASKAKSKEKTTPRTTRVRSSTVALSGSMSPVRSGSQSPLATRRMSPRPSPQMSPQMSPRMSPRPSPRMSPRPSPPREVEQAGSPVRTTQRVRRTVGRRGD